MSKAPSVAMLALGKLGKKPAEDGEGDTDGLTMAMEDLMSAIEAGDAKGAADAFRSACQICEGDTGEGGY